jgi:hypothetical protein
MNKTFRRLAAFAVSATMQGGLIGVALAQITPSASNTGGMPPQYEAPGAEVPSAPSETPPSTELPVLYVTSVEVLQAAVEPKLDIVRVTGLVASEGWTEPELMPTYAGKPADDILDLEFIATTPVESQKAGGFVPIDAIFAFRDDRQLKGVRVRASGNAIEVRQIPGRSQGTIDVNGCKDCVGKKFVGEGHSQAGQQGVVRQEDLPKALRLITASSGIGGAEQNPNRLTLILGDDNTIVEAFWE